MNSLVVYYSRSGNTKKVAEEISSNFNSEIDEIVEIKERKGIMGFLRGGSDASKNILVEIQAPNKDPSNYDLLVIGTPTWAGKMAPAVRTYLNNNMDKIKNVAFFCTYNNLGDVATIKDMSKCCGINPVSTLSLNKKERKNGYEDKLRIFIENLNKVDINDR